MKVKKLLKSALIAGAAVSMISIYSCGGGGGGGTSYTEAEETGTNTIYGNAIDGYIFGGTVFADCNQDGQLSSDEPSGFTFGEPFDNDLAPVVDLDGNDMTIENYALDLDPRMCGNAPVYTVGGYDTLTHFPFGSAVVGQVGKYDNNLTIITSLILSVPENERNNVESVLSTVFGEKRFGINYVIERTTPQLLKFVLSVASGMQVISQKLGQLDIATSKNVYASIAKELMAKYPRPAAVDISDTDIINIVSKGIAQGLSQSQNQNFTVEDVNTLQESVKLVLENVVNNLNGDEQRYLDLGSPEVKDSAIAKIHNVIKESTTAIEGVQVGKFVVDKVKAIADTVDEDTVKYNGTFDLEVDYTDKGQLQVIAYLTAENKDLIKENGTKEVDITFAIKPEPRAVDKRSAVVTFRGAKVTVENGEIVAVDTENIPMYLDGTDSNGVRVYRTVVLENAGDVLSLVGKNTIRIDVQALCRVLSQDLPEGHPLKEVKLDNTSYNIGISVLGLPVSPVAGNLVLH
ncbi:MAG: hypothetical protein GXO21_02130 [Aquificae bacterium]|nr:hypothetical protein [Aquificota bacterium]